MSEEVEPVAAYATLFSFIHSASKQILKASARKHTYLRQKLKPAIQRYKEIEKDKTTDVGTAFMALDVEVYLLPLLIASQESIPKMQVAALSAIHKLVASGILLGRDRIELGTEFPGYERLKKIAEPQSVKVL
ncbi:hypothetical protein KIPB_012155 [Kipferlia bialata]|uniref:Mon2/Sec7/BIG1-like dimerisation and cyclophilin-binding domain-containing protein n=1 Tax=Kipferlia bialata TaxID=797122 RepID=A0A9K3GP87_9EUKA|nr:hypothetical protein KIPB_012155 [Kipferlia bialata]|eukprot:g12155.t1